MLNENSASDDVVYFCWMKTQSLMVLCISAKWKLGLWWCCVFFLNENSASGGVVYFFCMKTRSLMVLCMSAEWKLGLWWCCVFLPNENLASDGVVYFFPSHKWIEWMKTRPLMVLCISSRATREQRDWKLGLWWWCVFLLNENSVSDGVVYFCWLKTGPLTVMCIFAEWKLGLWWCCAFFHKPQVNRANVNSASDSVVHFFMSHK